MKNIFVPNDIKELASCVSLDDLADKSHIILSISPCRSGSTAIMRAFGAMGIDSHLQPLKNLLRWHSLEVKHHWQPYGGTTKPIYIKETLGPFSQAEVQFNPLELLLATGISAERLSLLVMGRLPLETWASWQHWWSERTNAELLIKAYQQTEKIRQQAQLLGVETTTMIYDAFRDYPVDMLIQRLCHRLGINYYSKAVENWHQLPRFGEKQSNIFIPQMPEVFATQNIRHRVEEAAGLIYYSRANEVGQLNKTDITRIEQAGVPEIYNHWRKLCEMELGLAITSSS